MDINEIDLAEEFAEIHKDEVRYVAATKQWFVYVVLDAHGAGWDFDTTEQVPDMVRRWLVGMAEIKGAEGADERWLLLARRVVAVMQLVRAMPPIAAAPEFVDAVVHRKQLRHLRVAK